VYMTEAFFLRSPLPLTAIRRRYCRAARPERALPPMQRREDCRQNVVTHFAAKGPTSRHRATVIAFKR
jgi:hypothetical protein